MSTPTFSFPGGRTADFSSAPVTPQMGTISLDGLKKLRDVGIANALAREKVEQEVVKEAQKDMAKGEDMDVDADVDLEGNKENIPLPAGMRDGSLEAEREMAE